MTLAAALASGEVALHPGADRDEAAARLLALPGIGPWTVAYIRMRALSDPDAFPATDVGVLRALAALGAGRGRRGRGTLASLALIRGPPPLGNPRTSRTRNTTIRGTDIMITPFLPSDPGAPAAPALYDIVDSPVGRLLLTGDEQALTGLYMLDAGSHSATVQPGWTRRPGGFGVAAAQLDEYFAGSRKEFDLPLAPRGTPFQLPCGKSSPASPTA